MNKNINNKTLNKNNGKAKIIKTYIKTAIGTLISAILIFLAFKCFMSPNIENASVLISGGVSGIARTISLIAELINKNNENLYLIYSISYFTLNIPMIIIAFTFGKRYGIFTLINIALVSIFTNFINFNFLDEFAKNIACVIKVDNNYFEPGLLIRTILAAFLNAGATIISYSCGSSPGGSDTLSYYFAVKKSMNIGKITLILSGSTVIIYSILTIFTGGGNSNNTVGALTVFVFAILYQLIYAATIDGLSKLNKKEQLQIITEHEEVANIITNNTKHSCTIVKSKGAYSNKDNYLIYTVITTYEVKHIVELIRKADPNCFIDEISVKQVYGKFINKTAD